jgi:hypothetical protein
MAILDCFARRFCKSLVARSEVCINVSTFAGFRRVSKEMNVTFVFAAFENH